MDKLRKLAKEPNVWYDPQGRTITLCVICEIDPESMISTQATMVISGLSVCSHHGIPMIKGILDGLTIKDFLEVALRI